MAQTLAIRVTAEQLATICMCLDFCTETHRDRENAIFDDEKEVCDAEELASRLSGMLR